MTVPSIVSLLLLSPVINGLEERPNGLDGPARRDRSRSPVVDVLTGACS